MIYTFKTTRRPQDVSPRLHALLTIEGFTASTVERVTGQAPVVTYRNGDETVRLWGNHLDLSIGDCYVTQLNTYLDFPATINVRGRALILCQQSSGPSYNTLSAALGVDWVRGYWQLGKKARRTAINNFGCDAMEMYFSRTDDGSYAPMEMTA